MVTGSFIRTASRNKFLYTEHRKDEEVAEDGDDDEDVLAELTRSVVIGENLPISPLGYSISEGRLAYNEEWDETAELQSVSEEESNDF